MKIQDALDLHLKEEASRIIGEVSGCVSRQVEVADFDVGVLSQVGLHDLRSDFARDGVGAGDGRVDV